MYIYAVLIYKITIQKYCTVIENSTKKEHSNALTFLQIISLVLLISYYYNFSSSTSTNSTTAHSSKEPSVSENPDPVDELLVIRNKKRKGRITARKYKVAKCLRNKGKEYESATKFGNMFRARQLQPCAEKSNSKKTWFPLPGT